MFTQLLQSDSNSRVMAKPVVMPPSMRDVDGLPPIDMDMHMSDPCPRCGGFRMMTGDYVCWGMCSRCIDDAYSN